MGLFSRIFQGKKNAAPTVLRPRTISLPGAAITVPGRYHDTRDDGGTTILDIPGTTDPTLRITLLFVEARDDSEPADMGAHVRKTARDQGREADEHFDGKVVDTYDEHSEEDGTGLLIRYWLVGRDNCMAIISLTMLADRVDTPLTKSVLRDIPAMIESFELAERTEYLETPSGTVKTRVSSSPDAPPQASRPFTADEQRQLEQYLDAAQQFRSRYASPKAAPLHPAELDILFVRWLGDDSTDKPTSDQTAQALGAAFGDFICRTLDMHWELITDEFGNAWAIAKPKSTLKAFPIESVRKRIESRDPNFFIPVFQTIQAHVESGTYATE